MAINIFQGAVGKSKTVNKAAQSSRATQAKAALAAPAEASNSGATAVKTTGTLSKVGNFIGKAAGVASKFLPGIGGLVSKGLANLFNDPEWWQSVPGDAITLNEQLRMISTGTIASGKKGAQIRATIAEFVSVRAPSVGGHVLRVTANQVTQYLMPQIRKVVNAVPLQTADDYAKVIEVNTSLYAYWRYLKKIDYMLKHGTTYIPNMNVPKFPVCQVINASWLQSTINRLEEYLRSNVRLPHTLCEYLAWRFGRVYRSNNSAKAGIILYNPFSITTAIADITKSIADLMAEISSSPAIQAANTDMYNAYFDHDLMVEIKDDTQFCYDTKEFMLRTNLDIGSTGQTNTNDERNIVVVDSNLDNPTTFMASTVSTKFSDDELPLFPVTKCVIYAYADANYVFKGAAAIAPSGLTVTGWGETELFSRYYDDAGIYGLLVVLTMCKSLDLYNKGQYFPATNSASAEDVVYIDLTAISIDAGTVYDYVIETEQLYAFANLVDIDRKASTSYAKAEKMVARDTANLIDTLDVATAKTA